jgi:hypothetical protein
MIKKLSIIFGLCSLIAAGCSNEQTTENTSSGGSDSLVAVTNNTSITDSSAITDEVTDNALKFQKDSTGQVFTIDLPSIILDNKDRGKTVMLGVTFRIAQIYSKCWPDRIFRSYQVEYIKTGSTAKGSAELFSKTLGVDPLCISILGGAQKKDIILQDSWFEMKIKNGKTIRLSANNNLLSENFLRLKNKLSNGDKSVRKELDVERKKIEQAIRNLPFNNRFAVEVK